MTATPTDVTMVGHRDGESLTVFQRFEGGHYPSTVMTAHEAHQLCASLPSMTPVYVVRGTRTWTKWAFQYQ